MKKLLKQLFCFHPRLQCEEYGDLGIGAETRVRYLSPWDLFALKEMRYECKRCGKLFWYPKFNFEEEKANEEFIKSLTHI